MKLICRDVRISGTTGKVDGQTSQKEKPTKSAYRTLLQNDQGSTSQIYLPRLKVARLKVTLKHKNFTYIFHHDLYFTSFIRLFIFILITVS